MDVSFQTVSEAWLRRLPPLPSLLISPRSVNMFQMISRTRSRLCCEKHKKIRQSRCMPRRRIAPTMIDQLTEAERSSSNGSGSVCITNKPVALPHVALPRPTKSFSLLRFDVGKVPCLGHPSSMIHLTLSITRVVVLPFTRQRKGRVHLQTCLIQ